MMRRMNLTWMKRRWLNTCCRWVAIIDARIEGYAGNKTLPGGGVALTWIAFIFLAIVACAGLFKDAKRTHLD